MLSFNGIVPIFRAPFVESIARGHHIATMRELADHFVSFHPPSERKPLEHWFDFFYSVLCREYPCEYVYKNSLATSLYLGRHDPQKSVLIDEFRTSDSRADLVIMNDTSTVYEVKSIYDSVARLESQISNYRKVFDKIVVVTACSMVEDVLGRLDAVVGLTVLNDDGELVPVREPQSNKTHTDPGTIFDCMRQKEFCAASKDAFGETPNIPNSLLFRILRSRFLELDPSIAHDLMVKHVRGRGKRKHFVDLITAAPKSLKHACLVFRKSQALAMKIQARLKEPFSQ